MRPSARARSAATVRPLGLNDQKNLNQSRRTGFANPIPAYEHVVNVLPQLQLRVGKDLASSDRDGEVLDVDLELLSTDRQCQSDRWGTSFVGGMSEAST